jgi:hypothetical protein
VYDGECSSGISPCRGSRQDQQRLITFELACLLLPIINYARQIWDSPQSSLDLWVHVDDVLATVATAPPQTDDQQNKGIATAAAALDHEFSQTDGLRFAWPKALLLVSSPEVPSKCGGMLGAYGGKLTTVSRRLGVDYALDQRVYKKVAVHQAYLQKATARHLVLRRIAKNRRSRVVYAMTVTSAATYGAEHHLIARRTVESLRNGVAGSLGLRTYGVPNRLNLLTLPSNADPACKLGEAAVLRLAKRIWRSTQPPDLWRPPATMPTRSIAAVTTVIARDRANTHPAVESVRAGLRQVGWSLHGGHHVDTGGDGTTPLDTVVGSPTLTGMDSVHPRPRCVVLATFCAAGSCHISTAPSSSSCRFGPHSLVVAPARLAKFTHVQ